MTAPRKKAPIQNMEPHLSKIVEAILYVISDAEQRNFTVTTYDIVKTLFLADKSHLNKFGRPITFDNYVAMIHGPVPTTAYNFLKNDAYTLRQFRQPLPWSSRPAPEIGKNLRAFYGPKREVAEDVLSESDVEEITRALTKIKSLDFKQIRRLTHEDPAYLDAWEDGSERAQFPMSLSLLFETPSVSEAADLAFFSKHN